MKISGFSFLAGVWPRAFATICVAFLAGCSSFNPLAMFSGPAKPKPADLGVNVPTLGVQQVWSTKVGKVGSTLVVSVTGTTVWVAAEDGFVAAIDARTGKELSRMRVGAPIVAGIGSDGQVAAVITAKNEVVAIEGDHELWRSQLLSRAYTTPFVAGGRVFVMTADRSVQAFDGRTGTKLWTQQRPSEPLVLEHSGVVLAVGDTLVVGLSGRLTGLNPSNGTVRWDAPIAIPRGTNDVERLVDLVGRVSRVGDSVCARAFQVALGCVDAARGTVAWTKPAIGFQGLDGDENSVFSTESNGGVIAWKRADGERLWSTNRLLYRSLSAPLLLGRSVVVADETGWVHFLSREDGSPLNRLATDGSAITAAPVVVGDTLVVVTRNGGVYGFRPQ